jgi:hypothetical protein
LARNGIGSRARRKDDSRVLYGEGQHIGDLRFPRMREVAVVCGPVAHWLEGRREMLFANAVNDTLRPLQVEITEIPITPRRVLQALAAQRRTD